MREGREERRRRKLIKELGKKNEAMTERITMLISFAIPLVPAVIGYVFDRWVFAPVRALPVLAILYVGVPLTTQSQHGFGGYCFLSLLYACFCIVGLVRKAQVEKVGFWKLHHFDWIVIVLAILLMKMAYVHPVV